MRKGIDSIVASVAWDVFHRPMMKLAYTYRGLFFVNEEVRAIEPNRSGSTFQLALRTQLFNHYYDF